MAATPGIPPICRVAVLTDRRHVLTQDAEGEVLLWDVSLGGLARAALTAGWAEHLGCGTRRVECLWCCPLLIVNRASWEEHDA